VASYRLKSRQKYRFAVCTWRGARPRQHWVSGGAPSPTTRPPRVRKLGWVRVVGLGALCLEMMAGAGFKGLVVQRVMGVVCSGSEGGEFDV
jgi:hypothetical protein